MNPAELLSLVTARAGSWERTGQNKSALKPADLMAALGMIHVPDGARLLLRAKYCGQDDQIWPLTQKLHIRALIEHIRSTFVPPRPKYYLDLSCLAVEESLRGDACRACHGIGRKTVTAEMARTSRKLREHQIIVCETCGGVGRKGYSEAERARRMGIPSRTWLRRDRPQYRALLSILDDWESQALDRLARQIN